MLHVHPACPWCMSVLHVSMLHIHAACPCYLSTLHVHATCLCCVSMLHVHADSPYCIPMVHVHSVYPCSMSMRHFNACPWLVRQYPNNLFEGLLFESPIVCQDKFSFAAWRWKIRDGVSQQETSRAAPQRLGVFLHFPRSPVKKIEEATKIVKKSVRSYDTNYPVFNYIFRF